MTIVRVGRGRGFVVEINNQRLILTAAHCLPEHPQPYVSDPTLTEIIGTLDDESLTIGATCLSLDVITDLAVLAAPPARRDDRAAFDHLMILASPLCIAPAQEGRAWIMALDGTWLPVHIGKIEGLSLEIVLERDLELGMSGGPVLNDDDAAVSLISSQMPGEPLRSGPCPHLVAALPNGLLD
jgi:hypothetical protein